MLGISHGHLPGLDLLRRTQLRVGIVDRKQYARVTGTQPTPGEILLDGIRKAEKPQSIRDCWPALSHALCDLLLRVSKLADEALVRRCFL
jgi:hypothetical protein